MREPRVGIELIEWLRKNYPARCISPSEDVILAHRYAAQVELANRLIRMGIKDDEHDVVLVDTE